MTASSDLVALRLGELVKMRTGRVAIDVGYFAAAAEQALATILALEADKDALVDALNYAHSEGFEWPSDPFATLAKHGGE